MIYLITGTPGSGKSLYAVSTLVQQLVSQKLTDKNGTEINRRLVVDGVSDLLMPHELLCEPEKDEKDNLTCPEGNSILNWPDWCQKGDVILIDECQRYWRPRGMGSKPPRMIAELETHRHKGIDFVIITQSAMLIDQNVRRLIYQHQHIRRILGGQRAIIYEWDSCAADVSRVKSAQSTKYWGYPKSAYALYKSSELHTKPKVKIPLWVGVPVLAIVGGLFVVPQALSSMTGVMAGKGIGATASAPKATASEPLKPGEKITSEYVKDGIKYTIETVQNPLAAASAPDQPASDPANALTLGQDKQIMAGCFQSPTNNVCACLDTTGAKIDTKPGFCESKIRGYAAPGQKALESTAVKPMAINSGAPAETTDSKLVAFAHERHIR